MMLVHTPGSFYALRFLLGVAEAGFFPGVIFYLTYCTYWYPAQARARTSAWFLAAIPVCGCAFPRARYGRSRPGRFEAGRGRPLPRPTGRCARSEGGSRGRAAAGCTGVRSAPPPALRSLAGGSLGQELPRPSPTARAGCCRPTRCSTCRASRRWHPVWSPAIRASSITAAKWMRASRIMRPNSGTHPGGRPAPVPGGRDPARRPADVSGIPGLGRKLSQEVRRRLGHGVLLPLYAGSR
jgi:hypothetical protein